MNNGFILCLLNVLYQEDYIIYIDAIISVKLITLINICNV